MSDARTLYVETLYKLADERLSHVGRLSQIRRLINLALHDVDDPDAMEKLQEALGIINRELKSSDEGCSPLQNLLPKKKPEKS